MATAMTAGHDHTAEAARLEEAREMRAINVADRRMQHYSPFQLLESQGKQGK